MKWYAIDSLLRAAACIAGLLCLCPAATLSARVWQLEPAGARLCPAPMSADTLGPSECGLPQLPDSVVRVLARRLGMVDSVEVLSIPADSVFSEKSRYERNRERAEAAWARLIPNQSTLQYAGSIGMFNVGLGWHYGRGEHWETELLVGFVPRFHSGKAHTSFTLKQRYVPWHCPLSRHRWVLEPLTVGLFFNTISGDDFWANQPDRYPKKYYGFSTKVRSHIYLGQRLRFNIPTRHRRSHKAVSFYYEISSCDLYIVSKATNKEFPWSETLSLALGLRWEM